MVDIIISNEKEIEYRRTKDTPERCTLSRIIVHGRLVILIGMQGQRNYLKTGGLCHEYKMNPALWAEDAAWMFRFERVEG